jgi:Uncharacterised protein family (UPF0259)
VTVKPSEHLSIMAVARDVAAAYRQHWVFLIAAAIVILLPQALLDAFLGNLNIEGIHSAKDIATLAAVPLTVAVNLFGQAVYAGFTAAVVVDWRAGLPLPKLSVLVRSLPIGGLILLDIVSTVAIAIGFLLFVLPGLVFATYFGIAPAVMKFERRGVLGSMRRSAQLVRGNFRRVFVLVVGVIAISEAIVAAVSFPFHGVEAVTLVDLGADGLVQPIEGLGIVLVAIRLLELHGEAPPPRELARALTHAAG